MAMVQSLLVRCLVSWFWENPYRARLIRHGADLHGKHLLPHYVIADIAAVAEELREAGYPFDTAWLDPFTEFRFPRLGTVQILSLIHISEPTRRYAISYAVFCIVCSIISVSYTHLTLPTNREV